LGVQYHPIVVRATPPLIDRLVEASFAYLVGQFKAGVGRERFERWCIAPTQKIVSGVRRKIYRAKIIFKKKWLHAWRWPLLLEMEELNCSSIDWLFCSLVKQLKPDVVFVDYVLSALFIRSIFWTPVRIVTITLNREAEFHAEMRRAGRLWPRISKSIIAQWR